MMGEVMVGNAISTEASGPLWSVLPGGQLEELNQWHAKELNQEYVASPAIGLPLALSFPSCPESGFSRDSLIFQP
jgi:hypothetical protein